MSLPLPSGGGTAAPTHRPTPAPTAPPAGNGSCPDDPQSAVDATPKGGTLDLSGCRYTTTLTIERAMTLRGGTLSAPSAKDYIVRVEAAGVTIDGLTTTGGFAGIWADNGTDLVVRDSTVTDAKYAGIMVLSGSHCTITANDVERIDVNGSHGDNAYGIALSNTTGGSAGAPSQDCTISDNLVNDVPLWHAFDTHGGQHLTFTHNTAENSSRAFFMTDSNAAGADNVVSDNLIVAGSATYNLIGITCYDEDGLSVTGNTIEGYPTGILNYQDSCTGLTQSGNTMKP